MQIKYSLLLVLLISGCGFVASAQEVKPTPPANNGCSCSFSSINQLGIVGGQAGVGGLLQSVNGVRYKTWFAGVGVGIDVYRKGSIPVFLDVRKAILKTQATPFVYADAGIHMPYKRVVAEEQGYENKYSNGFYSDAGVGYKLGGAVVSAGYSYKRVKRVYRYTQELCEYCYPTLFTYTSYLHRVSIKIGWQL